MLIKWFFNHELSLPLGIALSVAKMGTVVNDVFSPKISSVIFDCIIYSCLELQMHYGLELQCVFFHLL